MGAVATTGGGVAATRDAPDKIVMPRAPSRGSTYARQRAASRECLPNWLQRDDDFEDREERVAVQRTSLRYEVHEKDLGVDGAGSGDSADGEATSPTLKYVGAPGSAGSPSQPKLRHAGPVRAQLGRADPSSVRLSQRGHSV